MKIQLIFKLFVPLAVVIALCTTAVMTYRTVSAFGFSGAIYTSKGDGTTVNANVYDLCADVYLNGGPQGMSSNGLPDGDYYFQVTNPSGSVLLSTDNAVCRQITVTGGRVAGAATASVNAGCAHTNGLYNPANGSTPVQLIPFTLTPNNGGEYKVWLIPVGSATIGSDPRVLTFNESKTDNFKCKEGPGGGGSIYAIGGSKYYDTNRNGAFDAGELGIEGITIKVTLGDGSMVTTETDEFGVWALAFFTGTTYTACEMLPPDSPYTQTGPTPSCWTGTVGTADITGLDFFNVICRPEIVCPANIENVPAGADCQATVSYLTPTSTDNCGATATVVCNPPSGSAFPKGTTTVTCTATSSINANNTASCSFTVTVVDRTPPALTLPQAIERCAVGGGSCDATVTFEATATDNCDGALAVTCSPASGSTFALGTTTVTCTATDAAGNSASGSFTVTIKDCSIGSISGKKLYDQNGSLPGTGGNQVVQGFKIVLSGAQSATTYTDNTGSYSFNNLPAGNYTVTEVAPGASWVATKATSYSFTVSCANASNVFTNDFCNYCKVASGGKTIGFWGNKNGQALITAADLQALRDLNLVNASGAAFDPTSAAQLNTWLQAATAVNMSYMLSAQLAAMTLNLRKGFVPGNAVDLCSGMAVNDLVAAAQAALVADGYTPSGDSNRANQESLKNCIDALNNNGLLVSLTPCPIVTPY